MCGRFTLRSSPAVIAQEFGLFDVPDLSPHYNIAPSQAVPVVRQQADAPGRELALLHWGLVPSWADDPSVGYRTINARAETAASKPSFRKAFRARRCLVVADGFYEWQKTNGKKQPFLIRLRSERPFGFAGLWERWEKGDRPIESCTILTTAANDLMQPLHDRMPVIIAPEEYNTWLDPRCQDADKVTELLKPYPSQEMTAYPVSMLVNNARNDVPQCVDSIA